MKTPYKLLAAITYSLLALAAGATAQSAAVRYNPADGTLTEPTTLNLTGAVTLTTADLPAGATLDSEIGTAAAADLGAGDGQILTIDDPGLNTGDS